MDTMTIERAENGYLVTWPEVREREIPAHLAGMMGPGGGEPWMGPTRSKVASERSRPFSGRSELLGFVRSRLDAPPGFERDEVIIGGPPRPVPLGTKDRIEVVSFFEADGDGRTFAVRVFDQGGAGVEWNEERTDGVGVVSTRSITMKLPAGVPSGLGRTAEACRAFVFEQSDQVIDFLRDLL